MIVGGLPPRKSVTARPLSHHPQYLPIGGCFLVDSRVERRRRQPAHRRLRHVHGRQLLLAWALCVTQIEWGMAMQLLVTKSAAAAYPKEMWTVQVHGGCQSWSFPVFLHYATDPSPGRSSLCDHGRGFGLAGPKILTTSRREGRFPVCSTGAMVESIWQTGRSCAIRRRRGSGHGA